MLDWAFDSLLNRLFKHLSLNLIFSVAHLLVDASRLRSALSLISETIAVLKPRLLVATPLIVAVHFNFNN